MHFTISLCVEEISLLLCLGLPEECSCRGLQVMSSLSLFPIDEPQSTLDIKVLFPIPVSSITRLITSSSTCKLPLLTFLCRNLHTLALYGQRYLGLLLAYGGPHSNAMPLSRAGSSQLLAAMPTPISKTGHLGMPTLFLELRESCQRNVSGYQA